MSLVFADRLVTSPVGILEDLQVKVGNTSIPADFVVLELEEESKDPLILERPFLCTVGAIIDVRQGKIDLNLGDIVIQFEMDELLKKPMMDGQTFEVDEGIDLLQPSDMMIEEILTEDPLELALVRAEAEQSVENIDADGYAKMLDSARSMGRMVASLSLGEESNKDETTSPGAPPLPNSPNLPGDPWSELKAPKVELKPLSKGPRFLSDPYPSGRSEEDDVHMPIRNIRIQENAIRHEIKFDFDSKCLAAFHTIKGAQVSAPIVQPPEWDLPFEIKTE
ncbi:PREDICTED: uncharacterized protein LOC106297295 [Brassica oleracea var. oleracea]|uniref:uncharacterized protein LOC106297295 n=1 Tax=Brassica oleracea var. oleracea TaxID=109376 RepID=UPI0006A6B97B|nr:PREDICTED: uncharacterized protein LOC106297295 [Brassica oleracea var. oleracea]